MPFCIYLKDEENSGWSKGCQKVPRETYSCLSLGRTLVNPIQTKLGVFQLGLRLISNLSPGWS